jgi:tetratricopeptide (TPR) repeat protein
MEDRFGQRLSTSSHAACEAYVAGVDILLTARPGALAHFEQAIAVDPDFALAHIARARAFQTQGRLAEANEAAAAAKGFVTSLSAREASHIEVLSTAIAGNGSLALEKLFAHMESYPRDGVVLSLAMGVYSLLGFSGAQDHHQQQRDLVDRLAPAWGNDWWFLGYRGWAHVETGNAAFGAPLIEQSLNMFRDNGNAAHARAHAYYELGETAAGERFLGDWLPDYAEAGSLHPHLSWHLALFALRNGDAKKAAGLFDARFAPSLGRQPPFFTVVDAGSFNWRNILRGIARDEPDLAETAAYAGTHFASPGLPFANVHVAYALAANDDRDALAAHVEAVAGLARSGGHPAAAVTSLICEGIQKFSAGDYQGAAELLWRAWPDLPRIGGSHAQRDGILETLVVALLRGGQPDVAEKVLASRLGLHSIWTS